MPIKALASRWSDSSARLLMDTLYLQVQKKFSTRITAMIDYAAPHYRHKIRMYINFEIFNNLLEARC